MLRDKRLARDRAAVRPAVLAVQASRVDRGREASSSHAVAAETPIALVYNGGTLAVMMATPADLEDLALGFSLAEGVVASPRELLSLEVLDMVLGVEARMEIPEARMAALARRQRGTVGGTACGMCGILSLEQALRPLPVAAPGPIVRPDAIRRALAALPDRQRLNAETGALHAAAFARPDGSIVLAREDVGRHNALDKLVGAASAAGLAPAQGFVLLTSRCSVEMVQKAATAGFTVLVAISAPTSLAIELAETAGLTLIAFARGERFTVYTGFDRIARA